MSAYYQQEAKRFKGRPKTSLVTIVRQDLKRIVHITGKKLKSMSDLEKLPEVAEKGMEIHHWGSSPGGKV